MSRIGEVSNRHLAKIKLGVPQVLNAFGTLNTFGMLNAFGILNMFRMLLNAVRTHSEYAPMHQNT